METATAQLAQTRRERAQQIAAGDLGVLDRRIDTTVSEALVLGLWLQGVRTFFCVFGHGTTSLWVYDMLGQLMAVLVDGALQRPGVYEIAWDGKDFRNQPLASGVYMLKLIQGEKVQSSKVTLLH